MPEGDLSAARTRIETVDRRLAALQDLGIDTAGLRSQLSLARTRLDEGGHGDAHAVLDEVAEAARRLAAGATSRSNEWRGLPRERVIEELRQIVAEGGAGEAVSALREHLDDRLREFERRLRDQFARELAQIIAARPWAKDLAAVPAQPISGASGSDLDQVRAEVDALVQRVAGELHAELEAVRRLAAEPRANDPSLRDDLERVRREVEALGRGARGADPAQLRALVDEALAGRAAASTPLASDDLLRGLVVQAGAIQDRLSERLLGLEQRIGGLVDRLTPALQGPLTGLTAIHIDVGSASGSLPPPTAGGFIIAATAMPFDDAIPAAIHLPDPAEPPSGSDWIFPRDESGSQSPIAPTEVARDPARPMVAIEQKLREASAAPADASEAKTAAFGIEQEAVTGPVVNDDRLPTLGIDEALVRRLIEGRLATWRPSPGDDLVSDEAEQARLLVRLLPAALLDITVRTGLFAALALEATARPGVLAELTGLRGFLRRELKLAVDEMKKELGVGV